MDRAGKEPIYIGTAVPGSYTQAPQFSVVRFDRTSLQERDVGLIFVSTKLSDFVGYYRTIVDLKDFLVTFGTFGWCRVGALPADDLVGNVLSGNSHFRQAIARQRAAVMRVPRSSTALSAFFLIASSVLILSTFPSASSALPSLKAGCG